MQNVLVDLKLMSSAARAATAKAPALAVRVPFHYAGQSHKRR